MSIVRARWMAVTALAVLLAAGGIGYRMHNRPPTVPETSGIPAAEQATGRATRAAPPTPFPAAPRHDAVAPAAPTSFEISGPAFDVKASVCQMAYIRPLDPPGDQHHTVCWVKKDFGVAPGSASGGTSYILGHSWSKAKLVFNPLSELAMKQVPVATPELQNGIPTLPVTSMNGYRITLRTPNGVLTYTVTRAFAVSKEQAGNVQSLMANTPNRVVLITCAVNGGIDADYNIVVDAYLTSSASG